MHLLFMRKNKTVSANLKNDKVLVMFEKNLKTFCSINNVDVQSILPAGKTMKDIVTDILVETKLGDSRAAKMELEEFLLLLDAFHQRHVHFR